MKTSLPYFTWFAAFLCFQPFLGVRGMPAGGALPPGIGAVKKVIACEDQKAYITCANVFNGIDIVSAMFGRKDSMVCITPGQDPASPCTAQEEQIKQEVKDLCQGENKCEVSASNDLLAMEGTTICPNVLKYLEVKYRCMPRTAIVENEGEVTTNEVTELVGGASSSASSSSSSSLLSNEVEGVTSASASASASASSSLSSSSSSSPASEVQVLLESSPFTRSENNVVEQLGVDQSHSSSQSSQEVTESIQMTQNDKKAEEKVLSPNTITETIKKSKIERVLPEETESEIEEEEDTNGSGMDEMDEGEDEESGYTYDDDNPEYATE